MNVVKLNVQITLERPKEDSKDGIDCRSKEKHDSRLQLVAVSVTSVSWGHPVQQGQSPLCQAS